MHVRQSILHNYKVSGLCTWFQEFRDYMQIFANFNQSGSCSTDPMFIPMNIVLPLILFSFYLVNIKYSFPLILLKAYKQKFVFSIVFSLSSDIGPRWSTFVQPVGCWLIDQAELRVTTVKPVKSKVVILIDFFFYLPKKIILFV